MFHPRLFPHKNAVVPQIFLRELIVIYQCHCGDTERLLGAPFPGVALQSVALQGAAHRGVNVAEVNESVVCVASPGYFILHPANPVGQCDAAIVQFGWGIHFYVRVERIGEYHTHSRVSFGHFVQNRALIRRPVSHCGDDAQSLCKVS